MKCEANAAASSGSANAGMARLPVAIFVSLSGFFAAALLSYVLPLYFEARQLPRVSWETWNYYRLIAGIFGPALAGLLAAWLGDRPVWMLGMFGHALVGLLFMMLPSEILIGGALAGIGVLQGFCGAAAWVAGVSLIQVVPRNRRGLSNALRLMSACAGSFGPFAGRYLVGYSAQGEAPVAGDFHSSLVVYGSLMLLGGILIVTWGQHQSSGPRPERPKPSLSRAGLWLQRNLSVMRDKRYLLLILCTCLPGGALFTANTVYRAYRAQDPAIGLIVGSQDHGWSLLQSSTAIMPILGGLIVGMVAGKKVSFRVIGLLMIIFTGGALGMGAAPNAPVLFVFAYMFQIMAGVIGWVESGYVSEVIREDQRSTGIGLATTFSGLGSWTFNFVTRQIQSPDSPAFSSALPFYIAAAVGLAGTLGLLAFDAYGRRRRALIAAAGG